MANSQLDFITQQALDICERLEQGQAETPLGDTMYALQRSHQQASLNIVLLGLSTDSLEQTLSWLYGDAFKNFQIDSTQWPGFVEVTLSESGFAFGLQKERSKSFDAHEAFQQALQIEMGTTKASVNKPFAMQVAASSGVANIKLLIPDSTASLLDSPSLLNALISQSNLCLISAPLRYTLSREDHEAVEMLTANMKGFWPLLTVDELADEVVFPEIGWWEQHKKAHETLAPKLITKHVAATIPALLTDKHDKERQSYIDTFYAAKMANNLNAIFERYQQQAGILEQRKAKLTPNTSTQKQGPDRRDTDKIRQHIDEQLHAARKDIDQAVSQMGLQTSGLTVAINQALDALLFSDLDVEEAHTTLKLSLNHQAVNSIRDTVFKEAKDSLKTYYDNTHQHVTTAWTNTNEQLQALAMPTLPPLDSKSLQTFTQLLDSRLEVNVNYRGEMPKRTLMTRLGESRKVIMGLSMGAMVLGGAAKGIWGVDLRQSLMAIAPLLLIGGFAYTYVQWPKEDAEKLAKELDKVRDGLKSEMRRVVSDLQRLIQQQMFDVLDTQKKHMQKQLQDTVTNFTNDLQQQVQQEQEKSKHAITQIDQELRQWQNIERQLERLKADAAKLERELA